MKIRKAKLSDLNKILDVFKSAVITMNENGINQWDQLYPTSEIIEEDILKNEMYVGIIDDDIASVVVTNKEFDDEYEIGSWQYSNASFAVIHRLCVNPTYQNQSVGRSTMLMMENFLQKEGIESIRLDAFSQNPYALKMYEKLGYKKVGEVNFRKGLFYLYEKKL